MCFSFERTNHVDFVGIGALKNGAHPTTTKFIFLFNNVGHVPYSARDAMRIPRHTTLARTKSLSRWKPTSERTPALYN
jgi:hypothetical protein